MCLILITAMYTLCVRDLLYLQMSMNATITQTRALTLSCALTRLVRSTAYARKGTGSQVEHVKVRNKFTVERTTLHKLYIRIFVTFFVGYIAHKYVVYRVDIV